MKWLTELLHDIGTELKTVLTQLKRGETWLVLGLIAGFGLLTYAVGKFAFRTDSMLRSLNLTVGSCRELTNGPIIFLFCGMIFFLLAAVLTFGELQRYFTSRARGAHYEARQALISGLSWGAVAVGIPVAALLFFSSYCR
ncbi:MAG: hypothetical protein ACM3X0_08685 [Bacteroidota bacterium]